MPVSAAAKSQPPVSSQLEQHIRERIETLSYLPTTAAVAMKFIELGKDLEAGPDDYSKVISADSALSTKILALANSSWFGVRHEVTKVNVAVNLLGLATVRALAISYCMAGLHNELRLTAEESNTLWEASLCKAVAAKLLTAKSDPSRADEAFAMGLFQDLAIPVMLAEAREPMQLLLENPKAHWEIQLKEERELFRLDHTELGRMVAQKLELPEVFVDAIAFHHSYESLCDFIDSRAVANAIYAASLFPHLLNAWNRNDAAELHSFVAAHPPAMHGDVGEILSEVQKEFDHLIHFFVEGEATDTKLLTLMESAVKETADNMTEMAGSVSSLMQNAACMGMHVNKLVDEQSRLKDRASHDSLTSVLNRTGFEERAADMLQKASRYGIAMAVAYLDLDNFKQVNDTLGHEFGDRALRSATESMREAVRQQDLVGRIGGDEFVILLNDCSRSEAESIVRRTVESIGAQQIGRGERVTKISISAGLLTIPPVKKPLVLGTLIDAADKLMYAAKGAGGNQFRQAEFQL